jgi:sialidase-1
MVFGLARTLALPRSGAKPASVWSGLFRVTLSVVFAASLQLACRSELALTDVFVSGKDGYHTYRIPAIIVTTNHTVLAFCEGRKSSRSDTGEIDLMLKRSTDSGRTWSAQQVVWTDNHNVCGNPAPVVDRDTGVIWLLMTWNLGSDVEKAISRGTSKDTRRVYVTYSTDDGRTWAKPRELTAAVKKPSWGWYATGPVNGIQLTRGAHRGRLVIPANHTEPAVSGGTNVATRSHVIFSDDHGQSWQLGGSEEEKTNESTVAELTDGSLLQNMRSNHSQHQRAVASSKDGGLTWSPVRLDSTLTEPVCQASLFRCTWPDDGGKSRLLFSNPANLKRERMTVRASYDEGASWTVSKVVWDEPAAYSGLAMLPDKSIGCLFERGKKAPYETITLARFSLDWLEAAGSRDEP